MYYRSKIVLRLGVLTLVMFCALCSQGQTLSPRTGNPPKTQTLTLDEFNKLPKEVQLIMKQHPEMYIIHHQPTIQPQPTDRQAADPAIQQMPLEKPQSESQGVSGSVLPIQPASDSASPTPSEPTKQERP